MEWSIGHPRPGIVLRSDRRGAMQANGVAITDRSGWLDVPVPESLAQRPGVVPLSVRLQSFDDAEGVTMLQLTSVRGAGREFATLGAAATGLGDAVCEALGDIVHREIARRTRVYTRPTQSLRAVRPATDTVPDDSKPGE